MLEYRAVFYLSDSRDPNNGFLTTALYCRRWQRQMKLAAQVPEGPSEKYNASPLRHGSAALRNSSSPTKLSNLDTRRSLVNNPSPQV